MVFDRLKPDRRIFSDFSLKKLLTFFLSVFPVNGVFDALWFDHRCLPNNCTQGKRFETDHIFPCTIGGQNGVDDFNESVMNLDTRSLKNDGGVALLQSVDWYLSYAFTDNVTGKKIFNPSLNITFQLPRHSNDVRAILMTFSSPDDPDTSDFFYSLPNNSRVRLFDFRNYMPVDYDLEHPRSLSYDCLVGLDHLANDRVYSLSLRALPFSEQVQYSIITNSRDQFAENFTGNTNPPSWRSTVAVAILTKQRKLHVVFEPAPIKFLVTEYTVQLIWQPDQNSSHQILASKTILQDSEMYNCLFPITGAGTYLAKVLSKGENCHGNCLEALSYSINLNLQETAMEEMSNIKRYLILGGSLAGILLILMAAVLRRRYRQYTSIKQDESPGENENNDSIQMVTPNVCARNSENDELEKRNFDQTTDEQSRCSYKCAECDRKADQNVQLACNNRDLKTSQSDNFSHVRVNRQSHEIPTVFGRIENSESEQIQKTQADSGRYSDSKQTSLNVCNSGMQAHDCRAKVHNYDYSDTGSNSCVHQTRATFHRPHKNYTHKQVNSDCNCNDHFDD